MTTKNWYLQLFEDQLFYSLEINIIKKTIQEYFLKFSLHLKDNQNNLIKLDLLSVFGSEIISAFIGLGYKSIINIKLKSLQLNRNPVELILMCKDYLTAEELITENSHNLTITFSDLEDFNKIMNALCYNMNEFSDRTIFENILMFEQHQALIRDVGAGTTGTEPTYDPHGQFPTSVKNPAYSKIIRDLKAKRKSYKRKVKF